MDLFTIGYEGMTIDGFVRNLLLGKVDIVADVRLNPISRKPFFSKKSLARALEGHGISYVHLRELGTPRDMRTTVMQTGDYEKFMHEYRGFLTTRLHELEELLLLVRSKNVALMCFEKDPDKCHRSAVAMAVKELDGNGLRIRSI
ncbi:MAG: DUF488 domain-containing protein [Syntrophobacteraceae bacterium]|nr:DUF488 domain-containing protein [Syntrophobacteraceae bacterium]